MPSRILIAGAGALGSVFGGLLATQGHDVTLLGRAPHLARVAAVGLVIEGLFGAHRVRGLHVAFDASELHPPFDAILVTVKSFDTETMLAAVAGMLAPGGALLSLQNGLGNIERVLATVGPERALGGRVIFGAEIPGPGRVRVTVNAAPVAIGAVRAGASGSEALARTWASHIADASIPAQYTPDVQAHLWAKVCYNAALNPLGALFGVPYGALAADPDTRAVMDTVIDECYAVAAARGVTMILPTADAYRAAFYDELVPPTAQHRSSMLQDIEKGRSTEIDAINGCVWAYGKTANVPTPVNATLTGLIHARERLGRERC